MSLCTTADIHQEPCPLKGKTVILPTVVWLLCFFVATILSLWFVDSEVPYPEAILMGSVLAVHIVFTPCWIYFAICKLIWMKTRGYPFSIGDRVLITGGKYRGYEAEIIHYCQSEIEYGICIKELKYENLEFYAGYLMAKHKLENDTNK